jgi:hypothetical protein
LSSPKVDEQRIAGKREEILQGLHIEPIRKP